MRFKFMKFFIFTFVFALSITGWPAYSDQEVPLDTDKNITLNHETKSAISISLACENRARIPLNITRLPDDKVQAMIFNDSRWVQLDLENSDKNTKHSFANRLLKLRLSIDGKDVRLEKLDSPNTQLSGEVIAKCTTRAQIKLPLGSMVAANAPDLTENAPALTELESLLSNQDYQALIKVAYKEKGNNEVVSWLKSKAKDDIHPPIQYLLSLIISEQIASSTKYKFSPESSRDTLSKEELTELAKYYAQGKTAFQIEVAECTSLQSPSLNNWLKDSQALKMPAESLLSRTPFARSIAIQAAKDSTDWIAGFVNSETEQPPVWLCGDGNVRPDSVRFNERLKAYNNAKEQVSNLR